MDEINKEIIKICREIENQHKLNKRSYKYTIQESFKPILPEFITRLEKVFKDSDILLDSLKRYIIIDWSKKDDLQ